MIFNKINNNNKKKILNKKKEKVLNLVKFINILIKNIY